MAPRVYRNGRWVTLDRCDWSGMQRNACLVQKVADDLYEAKLPDHGTYSRYNYR